MKDLNFFNLLKTSVVKTFLKTNRASGDVKQWAGKSITLFQEDLFHKVKARVSEKWFYTYFKNDVEKLPRIDMLNLLSQYVGYKNWVDFKLSHTKASSNSVRKSIAYILPLLLIITLIGFWFATKNNTYTFCFINDIDGQAITNIALDVKILTDDESPIYLKSDANGCITHTTKADYMKFVVQSPYHKTDTIIKSIHNLDNGNVKLNTDDYALMLDYYSKKNVVDWNSHRKNLENIFSNDALIYQVFPNNIGIELFSKDEFINKLTIPTKSLERMKIISKSYAEGKIVKLKFIIE